MSNNTETIRKFVNYLNNSEESGGYWLPNIQRAFVWNEDQIEKLYDSILREYPIGSLLIWKNNSMIKYRKFIDHYKKTINLLDFYIEQNTKTKMLVLDGQQRLQSLYVGLKGSYEGKILYFNILSGELDTLEDKKYQFKFYRDPPSNNWIKLSELVFTEKRNMEIVNNVIASFGREVMPKEKYRIEENIDLIRTIFCTQENIVYQEVDSIDRPSIYTDNDIVEIFIRANAGGTKLDKSDLLFSLLVSSWDDADEKMGELLRELNRDGFEFGRDFILKTCLVILKMGARYEVEKFRKKETKKEIEDNWDKISSAIKDVKDFVKGRTFIQSDKVLSSYLVLIPLIYYRYHNQSQWSKTYNLNEYLVRSLIVGAFSGNPDSLIDKIIKKIEESKNFDIKEVFQIITDNGRNMDLSKENLLSISYTDRRIHLLFNLWHDFNYDPSYIQNEPQVDHIFPQSLLRTVKVENPITGYLTLMKYKAEKRDLLGNLMLLTRSENGAGGKSDIPPDEWFKDKSEDYLQKHLIPKNKDLWYLDRYEEFIEERNKLILEKFKYLIAK